MLMRSLQNQAKHRQVSGTLRYINLGMAHGSAGRAKFYPLQFTTEPEE
jgi:hypothetical protein